jgi:hypothetical protein
MSNLKKVQTIQHQQEAMQVPAENFSAALADILKVRREIGIWILKNGGLCKISNNCLELEVGVWQDDFQVVPPGCYIVLQEDGKFTWMNQEKFNELYEDRTS